MPAPVTKETRLALLHARLGAIHLPLVKPAKKVSGGNPDALLMIVFGHALTDLMGEETAYLKKAMALAELTAKNAFFSYAIRGSMLKDEGGQLVIEHRDPRRDEMETYRPFLLEEISIVRPAAVLCVGSAAIKTLLGDPHFSVLNMAGAEIHAPGVDCPVMATVSFSYVLKTGGINGKFHRQFLGDLKHAKELSEAHPDI